MGYCTRVNSVITAETFIVIHKSLPLLLIHSPISLVSALAFSTYRIGQKKSISPRLSHNLYS